MPLIINTQGKLVRIEYNAHERLMLALKALKKRNEELKAANDKLKAALDALEKK